MNNGGLVLLGMFWHRALVQKHRLVCHFINIQEKTYFCNVLIFRKEENVCKFFTFYFLLFTFFLTFAVLKFFSNECSS